MRYRHYAIFMIILFSVFQASCGTQPGQPGSEGDTGIILSALIEPEYNDATTSDVDAVQDLCPDGTAEPFFKHQAAITISALLERPDLNVQPGTLYIDQFTIDFIRSSDSTGAPPIEQYHEYITVPIVVPLIGTTSATETTFTAMFVDIPRKIQYATDMGTGQFVPALNAPAILNNYTAVYTFYGKNDFGTPFQLVASAPFVIGHFDNCTQ